MEMVFYTGLISVVMILLGGHMVTIFRFLKN